MQFRTGGKSPALIGALLFVFALIVFFVLVDIHVVLLFWLALAFLAISGIVLVVGLFVLISIGKSSGDGHNKVFLLPGVASTLFVYFFVTFAGVLLANSFLLNIGLYAVLNIAVIGITATIVITMFSSSKNIAKSDRAVMDAKAFMDDCEMRVQGLMSVSDSREHAGALQKLYEDIKYSDKVGSTSVDYQIGTALSRLETGLAQDEGNQINVHDVFEELAFLLKRRTGLMANDKRGGF